MCSLAALLASLFCCTCIHGAFDANKLVIFKLFKRNETDFVALNRNDSRLFFTDAFDPKLPTRIYIHGFLGMDETVEGYRQAFSNVGDFNFIACDWSRGAYTANYFLAKSRIQPIAERMAELIDALVKKGMNSKKTLTLIGHSLGAHLAGLAAKKVRSGKIGAIIGLDPASIGFSVNDAKNRLAKSDATYVQVIHTNTRLYGFEEPIGHADYYVNGGAIQPGCSGISPLLPKVDECSHSRSHELFWETLSTNFTAIHCASHGEIKRKQCSFNKVTSQMAGDVTINRMKSKGVFYLETTKRSPFIIADHKSFKDIQIVKRWWF